MCRRAPGADFDWCRRHSILKASSPTFEFLFVISSGPAWCLWPVGIFFNMNRRVDIVAHKSSLSSTVPVVIALPGHKAYQNVLPRAISPSVTAGRRLSPPCLDIVALVDKGPLVEAGALICALNLIVHRHPSGRPADTIRSESTFSTTPVFGNHEHPESMAALYSIPVPLWGLGGQERNRLLLHVGAHEARSCHRSQGRYHRVATETTIFGETSINRPWLRFRRICCARGVTRLLTKKPSSSQLVGLGYDIVVLKVGRHIYHRR